MTNSQIYTWIFLSLSEEPSSVREITDVADGVNHAVPTQEELRSAFQWLSARGLSKQDGTKYSFTQEGAILRKKCVGPKMTIRESWASVEKQFIKMGANEEKA